MKRQYADQNYPVRHDAAMPHERIRQLPWIISGRTLITPFPRKSAPLTAEEEAAVAAMRHRLASDRPASDAWVYEDGRVIPLDIPSAAWLSARLSQNVAVPVHA